MQNAKRHKHRRIDTHAHIFNQQLSFVRAGEGYIPDYDATLETYLHKLAKHGLSHGVLIQPSFLGTDNSHLLEATSRYPELLRGIVIVAPDTPVDVLRGMSASGIVGTRVILYGGDPKHYALHSWYSFAERLADLDWIVEMYGDAIDLDNACEPFLKAGCRLLIDHYGRPSSEANVNDPGLRHLMRLSETGRVWVDISGPYRNGTGQAAYQLSARYVSLFKETFGLSRMVWGSDWPCVQYEPHANYQDSLRYLESLNLTDEELDQLLWQTPSQLFGFCS